jgi:hypothetical protein
MGGSNLGDVWEVRYKNISYPFQVNEHEELLVQLPADPEVCRSGYGWGGPPTNLPFLVRAGGSIEGLPPVYQEGGWGRGVNVAIGYGFSDNFLESLELVTATGAIKWVDWMTFGYGNPPYGGMQGDWGFGW